MSSTRSRRRYTTLALFLPLLACYCWPASAPAARAFQQPVPTQFMAKMYTEGLGRAPDQEGWRAGANYFAQNGCNRANLKTWGRGVYLSTEYNNLAYDNAAKLLTLYRGALNREPTQPDYGQRLNQLNSGTPWAAMVDAFFDLAEFQGLVARICGGGAGLDRFSYGFGRAGELAIQIPTTGGGFAGGDAAELQSRLDAAPAGGTVTLAQKAVIYVTTRAIELRDGKTLTTAGGPARKRYALLGRIVRGKRADGTPYRGPLVRVRSGGKLRGVWFDGSRGQLGYNVDTVSVLTFGGSNTLVSDCVFSNTSGWTSLRAYGAPDKGDHPDVVVPCYNLRILHNLMTSYSSLHTDQQWADGVSVACENALIQENEVVDATDVGIIIYRASPATQASKVRLNVVLSAGNSAYGAYAADQLQGSTLEHNFTGAAVEYNTLWTGPNTHFDLALAVGTRPWFGAETAGGRGVAFSDNKTGLLSATADSGIGVSNMKGVFVQRNVLNINLRPNIAPNCPSHYVWVDTRNSLGNIQPYTADNTLNSPCMGVH